MSDTLNWDELDHSDDWEDRTTREPEMVPENVHLDTLQNLEDDLNALYESKEVQDWLTDGGLSDAGDEPSD